LETPTPDALAAEAKEIQEPTEKMYDDHYPAEPLVPMGATSFAEVDAFRQAQGVHEQVKELTTMFQTLSSNIMWDPTIEDKPGALRGLVDELDGLLADAITEKARPSVVQRLIGKAKELLGVQPPSADGLMVWKEGGLHRWLAVYSNKYRDQDVPPEILSAKAHKEFVEAVDSGAAPTPNSGTTTSGARAGGSPTGWPSISRRASPWHPGRSTKATRKRPRPSWH
jgi:hypothetical protein